MTGKKVKKPLVIIVLLMIYLLGLSMTITCLIQAVKKRIAFYKVESQGTEIIEIIYLFLVVATITSDLISMCCSLTSNEPNILGDGGAALVQLILAIVWIVLPTAYTILTSKELEGMCPVSLTDDSLLLNACIARKKNFIFMWVNSGIMILSTFTLCFCYYGLDIQGEEIIIDQEGLNTRPISSDNSVTTPPVLKRLGPYFCNE